MLINFSYLHKLVKEFILQGSLKARVYISREIDIYVLAHLISRSSTCSENHRDRGNVLERHKAASMSAQPRRNITKAKTFKYMRRLVCQIQN